MILINDHHFIHTVKLNTDSLFLTNFKHSEKINNLTDKTNKVSFHNINKKIYLYIITINKKVYL